MKLTRRVSMILALSLAGAAVAYGQGGRDRDDRRDDGDRWRDNDRRRDGDGWRGRGAGPDHRFYRGNRLPPEWRHNRYVVNDWRGHRLNAPPRGYHWVQTGADYVLVAIATGLILQILLTQ